MELRYQVDRIEHEARLDPAIEWLSSGVRVLLPSSRRGRNAMHGTWLGHPVHPMLTDLTIGCWLSAVLLDLLGGPRARPAVNRLVGIGLLSAPATALTGAADWEALSHAQGARRTGLVHALGNITAVGLFALSWLLRRRGRHRGARRFGLSGLAVVGGGAYLGGHLAYRQAVGVDHSSMEAELPGWTSVLAMTEVAEDALTPAVAGETHLVLYRRGAQVFALAAHCAHLGGPLADGEVSGEGRTACITCPWHGSTFAVEDGRVITGPATAPQPAYETRVRDGQIEVRPVALPARVNGRQRARR